MSDNIYKRTANIEINSKIIQIKKKKNKSPNYKIYAAENDHKRKIYVL